MNYQSNLERAKAMASLDCVEGSKTSNKFRELAADSGLLWITKENE
jgi:hypothetical protein